MTTPDPTLFSSKHQRVQLIEELIKLTKAQGCHGHVSDVPLLSDKKQLSLEEILGLQVMMGSDRAALSLELGANPNAMVGKHSLVQLARAFENDQMVDLLQKYGAKTDNKRTLSARK